MNIATNHANISEDLTILHIYWYLLINHFDVHKFRLFGVYIGLIGYQDALAIAVNSTQYLVVFWLLRC